MSAFSLDDGTWVTEVPRQTQLERILEARKAKDVLRAEAEDEENESRRLRREEAAEKAAEKAQAEADADQFEAGRQAGMNFRI